MTGDARPLHVVAHDGAAILGGGETGTALLPRGLRPGVVCGAHAPGATIRGLLADPARLAAMGAAARRRAEERFGAGAFLDRWDAVPRGAA